MENVVLAHAVRHIIIHKNGIIDKRFVSQIKDTRHKSGYSLGENLKLEKNFIKQLIDSIEDFAMFVNNKL